VGDSAPVRETVLDIVFCYSGNGNLHQPVRQMSLNAGKVASH
jgi:hypothetical protein